MSEVAAIILAAGKSTRMKSDVPKVLHEVCGKPMLAYVLAACFDAGVERIHLVVGYQKERVIEAFNGDSRIRWVEQREQLGTGHAVLMCEDAMRDFNGDVLVIAGDMPLLTARTLAELIRLHQGKQAAASLCTTELDDPTGYGRIVRDAGGELLKIVEHGDCTEQERRITEVNPSYYCFNAEKLFEALHQVRPDNVKGEYYVTDALEGLIRSGHRSATLRNLLPEDTLGVNSPEDLERVSAVMRRRARSANAN